MASMSPGAAREKFCGVIWKILGRGTRRSARVCLLGAGLLGAACARSAPPAPVAPAPPQEAAPPAPVLHQERPGTLTAVPDARLQEPFHPGRLDGTVVVYDTGDGVLRCGDLERCARGYVPASTFKIANLLIALENGVVTSAETPLRWDGQTYSNADWNRDHTVRSAFRVSCVPCFQQIAREVGETRMRDWLVRLEYGNQDNSGSVDFFWLGGALRISPLEQVDFLWRLDTDALAARKTTTAVARDVMEIRSSEGVVLRGKTGWAGPPETEKEVLWLVGWVELGKRRVYFATVIDERAEDVDGAPSRLEVTERALRNLGVPL